MTHLRRVAQALAVVGFLALLIFARSTASAHDDDSSMKVALLVLEGVYNSELAAPMDILHHTVFHTKPAMEVFTVGRSKGVIRSFEGLGITVDHDLESAPPFDVLVVPSALHNMDSDLEDTRLIEWVRSRGSSCEAVLSICDGAFVLAEAGLLDGRYCTTFPGDIAPFRARYGERLKVIQGVTFVADGNAITGVGGARSYEPALYLVERLYGKSVAKGVARGLVIDWDIDRQRHLVLPERETDDPVPSSYLPGQRVDGSTLVENAAGETISLQQIIENHDNVKAVVLCILAGAEAIPVAGRGGLWCEDSFSELANLRHLKLTYGPAGVLFIGVMCPPVHHEQLFGYDEGAFIGRSDDDEIYQQNRARFVHATETLRAADQLPFDVVVYDPHFRLLRHPADTSDPSWFGRLRWFADTQMYGTPTTWVLTDQLDVLGPPFVMNVYESEGRKLRYTTHDISRMIDICLEKASGD